MAERRKQEAEAQVQLEAQQARVQFWLVYKYSQMPFKRTILDTTFCEKCALKRELFRKFVR